MNSEQFYRAFKAHSRFKFNNSKCTNGELKL